MTNQYICNWCGNELSEDDGNTVSIIPDLSVGPVVTNDTIYHLCDDHAKKVRAIIEDA